MKVKRGNRCCDDFAGASIAPRVAAVLRGDPSEVEVWNVKRAKRLARFPVRHDSGGARLAINPLGTRVVTGAYHKYGVRCYDTMTGEELWVAKNSTSCQQITIAGDGKRVFVGYEARALQVLDIESGECIQEVPGALKAFPSLITRHIAEERRGISLYAARDRLICETGRGRQVAAVAFSPRYMVYSNYCFGEDDRPNVVGVSLRTGKVKWEWMPSEGGHVLSLGWREKDQTFIAVQQARSPATPNRLVAIRETTGSPHVVGPMPWYCDAAFLEAGEIVVFQTGDVLSTNTGRLIRDLPIGER